MTNRQLKKTAQEIIEGRLGFKVSINDITLFESSDDGKKAHYILFGRYGFGDIQYRARYNDFICGYELTIVNRLTDDELFFI